MSPGARALYWLGVVLMLLSIADVVLVRFFRIDVTGLPWSTLALGCTGIILMQIARFIQREPQTEEEA
ncbi:hypothetical protein NA78x_005788 [Anatilimnocola sp. NA78]|uniref:hypothetical protein n=1 Tax=Anatilimnocola sp. NA78 TaxID=3415683 RepID=UPI003CE4D430